MSRRSFTPKTVRVHQNPITGQLERTFLDVPQKAYELVAGIIDGQGLNMSPAEWEKFIELVTLLVLAKRRHIPGDELSLTRQLCVKLGERLAICAELLSKCAERKVKE